MPSGPHLLENICGPDFVGPEHDGICPRDLDDLVPREIGIAGHKLLFDHKGMAEPPRGIAKLDDAKPAVAAVHTRMATRLRPSSV